MYRRTECTGNCSERFAWYPNFRFFHDSWGNIRICTLNPKLRPQLWFTGTGLSVEAILLHALTVKDRMGVHKPISLTHADDELFRIVKDLYKHSIEREYNHVIELLGEMLQPFDLQVGLLRGIVMN